MLTPGKFRHKALQKMSSPEQLDKLLKVTIPRRWIGLTGLLLIVAAVVVWSAAASVPTTLKGPGFLLPEGGLREVQAPISGTVEILRELREAGVRCYALTNMEAETYPLRRERFSL